MDKNSEIIHKFETLLRKQTSKEPLKLYSNSETQNKPKTEQISYSVKDVLVNVCKQIKAIQNADVVSSKRGGIPNKYKKKDFLTVDMIPVNKEVQQNKQTKFETQCVSDTQLINVIENAEIIDKNRGVTQEFDTTFCQKSDDSDSDDVKKVLNNKLTDVNSNESNDIVLDDLQTNTRHLNVNKKDTSEMDTLTCVECHIITSDGAKESHQKVNVDNHKCDDDTDRSTSPVLNAKRMSPPLVYSLYTFEKFENLAHPIIEEHTDLQTAKNIINSQIVGSELFIPNHIYENNDRDSPVLNNIESIFMNANENVIDKDTIKSDKKEIPNSPEIFELVENDDQNPTQPKVPIRTEFQDEILFSSDEEEEYLHKEVQELPLTCALETSFYDKSDVLDKTMYVGFQTASNKSIQISTNSFCKARSILSAVVNDETSLQDLVEIFDTSRGKGEQLLNTRTEADDFTKKENIKSVESDNNKCIVNFNEARDNIEEEIGDTFKNEKLTALEQVGENNDDIPMSQVIPFKSIATPKFNKSLSDILEDSVVNTKRKLEGFKTASNKRIKLSDKALARCKKVFRDINYGENIDDANCIAGFNQKDVIIQTEIKTDTMNESEDVFEIKGDISIKDAISEKLKSKKEDVDDLQINDQDFIQEFDDNEMLFEKTNYNIEVSDSSLAKAKDIFHDIIGISEEIKISNNLNNEDENTFKKPLISEKVLIKPKKPLLDVKEHEPKNVHNFDFAKPSTSQFIGFKTAANKEIKISSQAVEKMKNFYKDIDDFNPNLNSEHPKRTEEKDQNDVLNTEDLFAEELLLNEDFFKDSIIESKETKTSVFKGFQTANNKAITISEKALQMSKKLLEDITNTDNLYNKGYNTEVEPMQNTSYGGNKIAKFKDVKNKESVETFIPFSTVKDPDDIPVNKELLEIRNNEASNIEKETPVFKGFQTASNKKVKISDKALAIGKKLFQDMNLSQTNKETAIENSKELLKEEFDKNNDTKKLVGCKTASSKPVNISADAKSKIILKEFDFEDIKNNVGSDKSENCDLTTKFVGFHTASNEEIKISENALAKSKQLLSDIKFNSENYNDYTAESNFVGFKTANSKKVRISDDALAKSNDFEFNKDNLNVKPAESNFVGFKTANNKEVKISEKALAKSKQIFSDIELKNDDLNEKPAESNFIGFKTLNNKDIEMSKDGLAESKRFLNTIDFKNDDLNEELDVSKFVGFKRASNKEVNISDEALAKSKAILKEEDDESVKIAEVTDTVFRGFQTASNKQVKISEKALEKSKKLFQGIEECKNVENANIGNGDMKFLCGFQTASKKKVEISEKALAKSRKVLEGIELSQREIQHVAEIHISEKKIEENNVQDAEKCFTGFQTASNKKVVISEQAIERTKVIFNEELIEPIKSTMTIPDVKLGKVTKVTNTSHKNNIASEPNFDKPNINKDIIDTQVLNDFQESLNTEDFSKNTPKSKRSGSPILSCPRAKKRRFETPYRNDKKIQPATNFIPPKFANTYKFKEDYKKNKVYTLSDLKKLEKDTKVDIDPYITKFNFDTLLNFEFFGTRNDYSEGKFDVNQIKTHFLDAVNKKIVPDGWLDNHIKLIIWKLLSYEIKFPTTMKDICSVRNVMDQLKYRYDKELYNVQRPILRKILEKDDVPSRTMVLCVAAVYVDNISVINVPTQSNNIELLLTDGWYCIRATIDRMLTQLVCNGSIVVGTKIATSSAELINGEQGKAPWEDTSSVRLKVHGNSTRRCGWSGALGACGGAVRGGLRARAGGGRGRARAAVARRYPALARVRGEGGNVILSERLEIIRQMKHESEQQALMEKLYEELEKELVDQESQDSQSYANDKSSCLESGSQISNMMKRSRDPDEYRSHLTASQNALLEEHNLRKREKKMEEVRVKFQEKLEKSGLKKENNIAHLLKVRLVDFKEKGKSVEVNKGYLSIWNPSAAVMEMMVEGAWIEIVNFIPTGMRNSEIQLSAGRQTVFKPYIQKNEKYKLYANTFKRKCYEIKELAQNPNMTTDYNEIDTVGMIFEIEPSTDDFDEKKQNFQNVFLADADKNMICVNFWGGLKKFGFDNVLDTGQIVTCVNLQKRAGNSRKSIPQYRVTEFTYFTKTPKDKRASELTCELSDKLSKIKDKFCEDCVVLKDNYSIFKTRTVENVSPYRFGTYNMPKRLESPMNCDSNLSLTGLDFDSSFTTQMSPEQLLRKKRVREKIDKLKMYGEPPPLSSIHIINKSKNASATYKSPLIPKDKIASNENTPQNVTSVEKENLQNDASPVGINRTFVKRVNPVKLNFSNSVAIDDDLNDSVDGFGDNFEDSLPLSLDSDVDL